MNRPADGPGTVKVLSAGLFQAGLKLGNSKGRGQVRSSLSVDSEALNDRYRA